MKLKSRFLLWFIFVTIAIYGTLFATGFYIWNGMSEAQRNEVSIIFQANSTLIISSMIAFFVTMGFAMNWLFNSYMMPLGRMVEEIEIINTVNPSYRLKVEGGGGIRRLAGMVNRAADTLESLQKDVNEKIHDASRSIEEEKNTFASLIAELNEGVIILNNDGVILLYNRMAQEFFSTAKAGDGIGLGRSVFSVIDRNLLGHALDDIMEQMKRENTHPASYFIVLSKKGHLLNVEAVPILNQRHQMTGTILIMYDITKQMESESKRELVITNLSEGFRSAIAGIRAASEILMDYKDLTIEEKEKFLKIIHDESMKMSLLVEENTLGISLHTQWPLADILASDLIIMLKMKLEDRLGFHAEIDSVGEEFAFLQVKAESFTFLHGFLFLASEVSRMRRTRDFKLNLTKHDKFTGVNLRFDGDVILPEELSNIITGAMSTTGEQLPLSLKEIISRHRGEIWSASDKQGSYIRILLPLHEVKNDKSKTRRSISLGSRPEFYDFNLFSRPGMSTDLDNVPLSELTFTIFDTETTGLDPSGGDKIISIGAFRALNGRLLKTEIFETLVNPKKRMFKDSIAIHGITNEMLIGQPEMNEVMPAFYKFCEGTVLVAHNAAFDMRFLELQGKDLGIQFTNPVLDTLLLSATAHPNQQNHSLEQIAERMGIPIVGRHTALGDAIVTGEVFLRLIAILQTQGIRTLKEAREASEKTFYARIKY